MPSRFSIPVILFVTSVFATAQQIDIPRIELMPNFPQPYEMRDWKSVAHGYDSLVFDLDATGTYLPLTWITSNTVNYPENQAFGLHTVVGTPHTTNAEGINCIPALVGASLNGIDKSNQNGFDYVLASQEWFNRRPSENVYLNNWITSTGNDWWYDTMPNVFFYQLKDLYGDYGDSDFQFESVASRWLEAVVHMGGSAYPWSSGNFNHRAWSLSTMTPNNSGVVEPEAAGSIGWLLYMAYTQSGNDSLRMGAEWSLEYLHNRSTNPSYEIQMPYGAVVAARMNAELGTNYDVDKMLNWCFDITPLRYWGATLGTWGGYDCDGLIGEAQGQGYAFAMNGFQHASALAPLARYDDRYARALGKWILNLANASRLFYPNYLPPENQDSEVWSYEFDPNSYIAHESMREDFMGITPYATGDAVTGGWGLTNLALYGSSHVGYLGALVDTTDVQGILQLDLLATDWFHDEAYPTYLYYNPYDVPSQVSLPLPEGMHDIYDLTSNSIVAAGVNDTAYVSIMEDEARIVAIVPAGGIQSYDLNKLLIDGIIVDYMAGNTTNHPPRIKAFGSPTNLVAAGSALTLYCRAEDREDGNLLSIYWYLNGVQLASTGASVQLTAPADTGMYVVSCLVTDSEGSSIGDSISIHVVTRINNAPVIESLTAETPIVLVNASTNITCSASDPEDAELTYTWSSPQGGILSGSGSIIQWEAPGDVGEYQIICEVSDPDLASDISSISIVVVDSSGGEFGFPQLYLPFDNNVNDYSGHNNAVTVSGATFVPDRGGNANSALHFDGVDDRVQITNTNALNFTEGISVSLWLRVDEFFGREAYPMSHGNWENRWKISITDGGIRWTVKTSAGIRDLDSVTELQLDTYYHVVALYDGTNFDIYMNGVLDQHTTFSGSINPTTLDLTIGQALPGNTQYNFKGIIDDVRLYDYGLSADEILNLYTEPVAIDDRTTMIPMEFYLDPPYPNPFNPSTTIGYGLDEAGHVELTIHDIQGRMVRTMQSSYLPAGQYRIVWNGQTNNQQLVSSGIYFCRLQSRSFTRSVKIIYLR